MPFRTWPALSPLVAQSRIKVHPTGVELHEERLVVVLRFLHEVERLRNDFGRVEVLHAPRRSGPVSRTACFPNRPKRGSSAGSSVSVAKAWYPADAVFALEGLWFCSANQLTTCNPYPAFGRLTAATTRAPDEARRVRLFTPAGSFLFRCSQCSGNPKRSERHRN
jgi:hypothetical protein